MKGLEDRQVDFAELEDATAAVMHLASDRDRNGRSIAIVPRRMNSKGYLDLEIDDLVDPADLLLPWQALKASAKAHEGNAASSH